MKRTLLECALFHHANILIVFKTWLCSFVYSCPKLEICKPHFWSDPALRLVVSGGNLLDSLEFNGCQEDLVSQLRSPNSVPVHCSNERGLLMGCCGCTGCRLAFFFSLPPSMLPIGSQGCRLPDASTGTAGGTGPFAQPPLQLDGLAGGLAGGLPQPTIAWRGTLTLEALFILVLLI